MVRVWRPHFSPSIFQNTNFFHFSIHTDSKNYNPFSFSVSPLFIALYFYEYWLFEQTLVVRCVKLSEKYKKNMCFTLLQLKKNFFWKKFKKYHFFFKTAGRPDAGRWPVFGPKQNRPAAGRRPGRPAVLKMCVWSDKKPLF